MNYFKQIFRFAIPYKIYGILNICCNVMYALFSALSFIAIFPVLKVLFNTNQDQKFYEPQWEGILSAKEYLIDSLNCYIQQTTAVQGKMPILTYVIVVIIAIFLLKNLFGYLALYFITFLRNGVLKDMRNELYEKVVSLPLSFYSEKKKGDTIARITSDVLEIQNSFLSILELIVREPLTILFTLASMLFISLKLTIFVFIFIPVSSFIISLVGKTLKKHSDKVQREQGHFLSIVEETLGGLKVIKGFNAEPLFSDKFKASTQRFFDYSNTLLNRQNLASPTSEFLGICVISVLLWYGGVLVFKDQSLEPELFIVYIGLAYNILTPAKAISKANYGVKRGNAAAERVLEVLETTSPLQDPPNAIEKTDFTKNIKLEKVYFKYEDEYVLKNFNLTVKKGTSVALVGQSGSGKSTIANLVTRFYDVNKGTIYIDDCPIKSLSKTSLRQLMGLVTQDSILFNETIKENLRIGKPDATDDEIIEALKVANAWEFVAQLPKGIATNIGDSGNKLSGGQKQRLSIARAVLKNPPIMILDEATSALDTESERLVQAALENMMKNRTSIVIAHRLSTIQNSDLIVVMQKGEIVEQGSHEELLQKEGNYFKLVSMQSFEE